MIDPHSRRGFLRGLTTLPLIGGGVVLTGSPTAAAVPVSGGMVATYLAWLHFEFRYVSWGAGAVGFVPMFNPGACFHDDRTDRRVENAARRAIDRAPVILSAAGCRLTCPEAEEHQAFLGPEHWLEGVRCA